MKKRIFQILEKAEEGDKLSKIFDYTIMCLILLTVIAIILESFQVISIKYHDVLRIFEIVSVSIFTIEYLLRIWTSDLMYKGLNKYQARIKFIFSFMALIDLLAILPFYLPMIIPFDLRFLRIIRLTRLLRIFKMNRYSKALNLIGKVFKEKKEELLATGFIMIFIIILSSTMIYYFENTLQPEKFPNIVASFWWAIATLTTVGYGDIYPITVVGKVFASVIAVSGIGLVALPTNGIISAGFMVEMKKKKEIVCPKCGEKFEDLNNTCSRDFRMLETRL